MEILREGVDLSCVIESEADAWELLQRAIKGEFGESTLIPKFKGWPNQEIVFWLDDEHEVITAPMAEAIIDYQAAIYRTYLSVEEDTTNLRRLSNEKRQDYEVRFQVGRGCTKILPDFTSAIEKFATTAAGNMTGSQLTIVIIGVVLMWTAQSAWKAWLDKKAKDAAESSSNEGVKELLTSQRFASQQDTERYRLLVDAVKDIAKRPELIDASEEAMSGVLRAAKSMDETEIDDIQIAPEVARRMSRAPRSDSEIEIIEAEFEVLRIDSFPDTKFRAKIRNVKTDEAFFAGIRDALVVGDDRQIISDAEWSNSTFRGKAEVKRKLGDIYEATLVHVENI